MSEIKFCKDCKWCRPAKHFNFLYFLWPTENTWTFAKCGKQEADWRKKGPVSLVTGKTQELSPLFASVARSNDLSCGASAKYWEIK